VLDTVCVGLVTMFMNGHDQICFDLAHGLHSILEQCCHVVTEHLVALKSFFALFACLLYSDSSPSCLLLYSSV